MRFVIDCIVLGSSPANVTGKYCPPEMRENVLSALKACSHVMACSFGRYRVPSYFL